VGKITEKAVCRSIVLKMWHSTLSAELTKTHSAELTKTHSFRLFFGNNMSRCSGLQRLSECIVQSHAKGLWKILRQGYDQMRIFLYDLEW